MCLPASVWEDQWIFLTGHTVYRLHSLTRDTNLVVVAHIRFFTTPGMQHTRLLCPPLSPRVCSNSCPLSQWCYLTFSSSAIPFSFCLQSFPASGSLPTSWLFAWGSQSIGASASASVLPVNTQDWSALGWTGWISLQSKGLFKSLLQHHSSKALILWHSAFFMVQLSHPYMTTGKKP